MRIGVFALAAAFVLAVVAAQAYLLRTTNAEITDPAITACAVQGGSCPRPSLDGIPGSVLSHTVFEGGCASSDLHVMRYVPDDSSSTAPLVVSWCT